jgi:hypothetical protein
MNSINYRIVEVESTESIVTWVLEHPGADIVINGLDRSIWVIVPSQYLEEFLARYGSQVSAV